MATRVKKKTISGVTLELAQAASEQFAVTKNKLEAVEAKMNEKLNKVKSEYQDAITELKEELEEPQEVLETFAKEQKSSWGKKKSIELLHCIIGFRTGTPKVVKDKKFTWDAVLELITKNSMLKGFVRSKEEINKEAILAEKNEDVLKLLKEECYVEVDQDETFFVQPKKEEVATV